MTWFRRYPRVAIGLLGVLLIAAGGTAVGYLNLRNLERIELIHSRLSDLERLRELRQRLETSVLDQVRDAVPSGSFLAEDVRLQVASALALADRLDPQTTAGLRRIAFILSRPGLVTRESLISAMELAGSIAERETRAQEELLRQVREDGRREFALGLAGLMGLALMTVVAAWFVPRRFLDPLSYLRSQFADLGAGRFEEVSLKGVDATLVPLFENYNSLVARLAELEGERKARADTLEAEVRAATRALLEQHQVLANAERLAAVGETAAGMAHELRNPLAGIMAALENLSRDVEDPDLSPRLNVLHRETERVVQLLNSYLAASRHAPEPPAVTNIGELVRDLLSLLRYQAPASVRLEAEVQDGLQCVLPSARIRQSLMNLVGNSIQALDSAAGTVTVAAERRDGILRMEVRDDGPGFPSDLLPTAGQRFRTGRVTGTGLGLATVQRTARDLGGNMTVSNLEPHGASVVLNLPCNQAEED